MKDCRKIAKLIFAATPGFRWLQFIHQPIEPIMRISNRFVFITIALAALGLLAAGLAIGEMARLNPCHLCNFQRFIYMLLAAFAVCGALLPGPRRLWGGFLLLTALAGFAAAVQQSWMQYAPEKVIECGIGDPTLVERIVNWLGMQWPQMFMVTGFCTDKEWVFFGLSLANWSGICFLLFAVVSLWLILRREQTSSWASSW